MDISNELQDAITEQLPHAVEEMECLNCGHRWVQVYPAHIERPTTCHKCGKNATIGEAGRGFAGEA